jgi:hypothetical protein
MIIVNMMMLSAMGAITHHIQVLEYLIFASYMTCSCTDSSSGWYVTSLSSAKTRVKSFAFLVLWWWWLMPLLFHDDTVR